MREILCVLTSVRMWKSGWGEVCLVSWRPSPPPGRERFTQRCGTDAEGKTSRPRIASRHWVKLLSRKDSFVSNKTVLKCMLLFRFRKIYISVSIECITSCINKNKHAFSTWNLFRGFISFFLCLNWQAYAKIKLKILVRFHRKCPYCLRTSCHLALLSDQWDIHIRSRMFLSHKNGYILHFLQRKHLNL